MTQASSSEATEVTEHFFYRSWYTVDLDSNGIMLREDLSDAISSSWEMASDAG